MDQQQLVEEKEEEAVLSDEEIEGEVKEISKEQQREKEKEFLRRTGFKEKKMEDKIQFVKKTEDGATIGRTYNERYKNGVFWGIRDGKTLGREELKEIEEIKQFYAFRRGEVQMPQPPAVREKAKAFEKRGRTYEVEGHEEPDAWLTQCWGNEAGINIEILNQTKQTDEYAMAVVRAHLGNQFVDEAVVHYFSVSKEIIAFEVIEKMLKKGENPIEGYDEDGKPILSQVAKYRIYKRYIRFKNFALRTAISMAARRAILKIMNREWREEEEIEAEEREARIIEEEKRR